jgi:hypothetical protein
MDDLELLTRWWLAIAPQILGELGYLDVFHATIAAILGAY